MPREVRLPIPWPLSGLSENLAFGEQEPLTTRDSQNVRSINSTNGRIMGAQRSGFSRFHTNQVVGDHKIQDMSLVVFDSRNVQYRLVENKILHPEQFGASLAQTPTNLYWEISTNLVVTSNDTNAPDGTKTAALLHDQGANFEFMVHDFAADGSVVATNEPHFYSAHIKPNDSGGTNTIFFGVRSLGLTGTNTSASLRVRFDTNGTAYDVDIMTDAGGGFTDVASSDPVEYEELENGWWRFGVGYTWGGTNQVRMDIQPARASAAATGAMWFWGVDCQAGTNMGPYQQFKGALSQSKTGVVNIKADEVGNVYVLDEKANVTKFSADLRKLFTIPLPVLDTQHRVRALAVSTFRIFAAVSEGGEQSKAKIYAYNQLPGQSYELLWERVVEWYTEDLKVFGNQLYTAQNDAHRRRSRVAVYGDLSNPVGPTLDWVTSKVPVPFPVRSMDVNSVGDVVVACDDFTTLDGTALYRENQSYRITEEDITYPTGINAEPRDFIQGLRTDGNQQPITQIWARYVASEIETSDLSGEYEDGATVLRWRDVSGNDRHFYADVGRGHEGPTLKLEGIGKKPTLRFATNQVLATLVNAGASYANRSEQKTALPGYSNAMWMMYLVGRFGVRSNQGCIISQEDTVNGRAWAIAINREEGDAYTNASAGQISVYDDTTNTALNASGTDAHPLSTTFDGPTLITYHHNGDVAPTGASGSGQADSFFRVDGTNVDDTYHSEQFVSVGTPTQLGYDDDHPGLGYLSGDEISEIVVYTCPDVGATSNDNYPLIPFGVPESSNSEISAHIDGYFVHAYGIYDQIASNHRYALGPMGTNIGPPDRANLAQGDSDIAQTYLRHPMVAKFSSVNGELLWLVNENTSGASSSNAGGVGYGVVVDSEDNVFSTGPDATDTNGSFAARKIIDQETNASVAAADGAWTVALTDNNFLDYRTPRLAVDASNNFYLPYFETNETNYEASLRVYSGTNGTQRVNVILPNQQHGRAVALNPFLPDYDGDLTNELAQYAYLASTASNDTIQSVHKIPLTYGEAQGGAARDTRVLTVSDGTLTTVSSNDRTVPEGGTRSLRRTARYIQSAVLYEKIYLTDGERYRCFDPRDSKVTRLEASDGAIPERARLLESWNGRLVLARTPDDPQNWYMSAKGDPTDFNFFPFEPLETQAVVGNNTEAGLVPDIVNCIIPYTDDVLLFGGDHSIYALSGDPAAGGRLDLISDVTGIAFGKPWTKDPSGTLYFFGSRGGLYRMRPGTALDRVSLHKIERELQEVDLANYYIRLAYNWEDEGIHIVQLPYGAGGTSVTHWFYCLKTDSFDRDRYGSTTVTDAQPTSILVFDGDDPSDRAVLFGCEDGVIRKWDKAESDDDVTEEGAAIAIDAYTTVGPIGPKASEGHEIQYSGLTVVLGDRLQGCGYEIFVAEEPDSLGDPQLAGSLHPGRNPPHWGRVTGPYVWVRFRNAGVSQRFSLESAFIHAMRAGVVRPRR